MGPIEDPEVQCLARIATAIKRDYIHEDAAWADSPFAWIRTRPSRQIGKIGEQLVAGWCTSKGMSVVKCRDSEADLIIEGHRVEISSPHCGKSDIMSFNNSATRIMNLPFAWGYPHWKHTAGWFQNR